MSSKRKSIFPVLVSTILVSPEKEPLETWLMVRSEKFRSSRPILSVLLENSEADISPGMIAQVDIIRGRRSILEYFWQPVAKIKETAFKE